MFMEFIVTSSHDLLVRMLRYLHDIDSSGSPLSVTPTELLRAIMVVDTLPTYWFK